MSGNSESPKELLPVEIEEKESYMLNYERGEKKEDHIIIFVSILLIISHILGALFNPSINLDHFQEMYFPNQPNINNITGSFSITKMKHTNCFLMIDFDMVKRSADSLSKAKVNLTALIDAYYDDDKIFEKGIHQMNVNLVSKKMELSSNSVNFFKIEEINFDTIHLTFALNGNFGGFLKCRLKWKYANSLFGVFTHISFYISEVFFLLAMTMIVIRTNSFKEDAYRPEFYLLLLLLFSAFIFNLSKLLCFSSFEEKSHYYYFQYFIQSFSVSFFLAVCPIFRFSNSSVKLSVLISLSLPIFLTHFIANFYSLVYSSVSYLNVYITRILISFLLFIDYPHFEKASIKNYRNTLLAKSSLILVIGFISNNKQLISYILGSANSALQDYLFLQTTLIYSVLLCFIFYPIPRKVTPIYTKPNETSRTRFV